MHVSNSQNYMGSASRTWYAHASTHIFTYLHMYMCTYILTYIHTYIHTHTYIHPYIHTYMYIFIWQRPHCCLHTCIHTHTCIFMYACTRTTTDQTPRDFIARMWGCTCTFTKTYLKTYLHTYIHTCSYPCIYPHTKDPEAQSHKCGGARENSQTHRGGRSRDSLAYLWAPHCNKLQHTATKCNSRAQGCVCVYPLTKDWSAQSRECGVARVHTQIITYAHA